jgi:hypothetical protein
MPGPFPRPNQTARGPFGAPLAVAFVLAAIWQGAAAEPAVPPGVTEIAAPLPLEISGVAAVPDGYAVVGDGTADHARLWPSGDRLEIDPAIGDPESIDVGFAPGGQELWLVLGENEGRVSELDGPTYRLPPNFAEVCGRGAEGLAVRWAADRWQVAVVWEGGFYGRSERNCDPPAAFAKPRVAILQWTPGEGVTGRPREFDLDVPVSDDGERFRAPDLVWDGDNLVVLITSGNQAGRVFSHSWLQRFDLDGRRVGAPFKLEERWGPYWAGRNWEALDWTLDGAGLVIGFDARKGRRFLAVFPYP